MPVNPYDKNRGSMPAKKKLSPKAFTISQAAKKLGITRAAVHKAIKERRLKAVWGEMVIKARMISPESLNAYEVDSSRQERGKKTDIG